MTYYAQTDPRWAAKLLGFNTDSSFNLGNYGCAITMVANGLTINGDDTTPDVVNNALKLANGFLPGGGTMVWSAVPKLNPAIIYTGVVGTLGEVNNWLGADVANYAYMEVKNSKGGQHFVLGNLVNTIIDSEDGHQKNMLTYPFVQAHLWRWATPGRGSATTIIPASNQGDAAMTLDEETNAYKILLPELPVPAGLPDARSGYQLILDAAPYLAQERATAAQNLADANSVNSQLQADLDAAKAAAVAPALSVATTATMGTYTANPILPTGITSETPNAVTRVANADGEMVDYGGQGLPTLAVAKGMVFKQYSTFVANGTNYVRTVKSQSNGQYYGTQESLFDPLPAPTLTPADTVHLNLSKALGAIGHWVYSLFTHKK